MTTQALIYPKRKCLRKKLSAMLILPLICAPLAFANTGPEFEIVSGTDGQVSAQTSSTNANQVAQPKPSEEMVEVHLPDLSLTTELSKEELKIIDLKRDVIIKYLYEQKELGDLRDLLVEKNRVEEYQSQKRKKIPLTPEEILSIRKLDSEAEAAKNKPLSGTKNLNIRTVNLDIYAPEPIELNVSADYASSIVFFDQTGKPWPVEEEAIGSSNAFTAQTLSKTKHIVVFENIKAFSESNALINLVGLPMPIVVKLKGSDVNVDSRLSVRIPKFGPNANVETVVESEVDTVDDTLLNFLNGTIPHGAKRYQLNGAPGEVYYHNKQLYLRTEASLHSPPFKSVAHAPTGHKAYIISPVTNLLMSYGGELIEANISKTDDAAISVKKSIFE